MPGFGARLGLLLGLLVLVAGLERWRLGAEAQRWREYTFLLLGGLCGALLGAGTDQVSLRIAPEYFEYGKGIERGPAFWAEVTQLGLQAGCVGGLVAAGLALWLNGWRREPWSLRRLARVIPWALGGALLAAPLGAWAGPSAGVGRELEGWVRPERVRAFRQAWGLHLGVYLGALLGLLWGLRPRPGPAAQALHSLDGANPGSL